MFDFRSLTILPLLMETDEFRSNSILVELLVDVFSEPISSYIDSRQLDEVGPNLDDVITYALKPQFIKFLPRMLIRGKLADSSSEVTPENKLYQDEFVEAVCYVTPFLRNHDGLDGLLTRLLFFKSPKYIGKKFSTTSSMKNLSLVTLQTLLEKELITVNDIRTSEISKDLSGFVFHGEVAPDHWYFRLFSPRYFEDSDEDYDLDYYDDCFSSDISQQLAFWLDQYPSTDLSDILSDLLENFDTNRPFPVFELIFKKAAEKNFYQPFFNIFVQKKGPTTSLYHQMCTKDCYLVASVNKLVSTVVSELTVEQRI